MTLVEPQLKTHQKFMEDELEKSIWFAGEEFTAADIQMSFVVEASVARGGLDNTRPKLMAWLEHIHHRPAYRRALEKGGAYELLVLDHQRIQAGAHVTLTVQRVDWRGKCITPL